LINNRRHQCQPWHDTYTSFINQVSEIRLNLTKNPNFELPLDFLRKLIFDKKNGVASRGQSVISEVNYQKLLQDPDFLAIIKRSIQTEGSHDSFKALNVYWRKQPMKNNQVIINRIIAACNPTRISTTVDHWKFMAVYNWAVKNGILLNDHGGDWHQRNLQLVAAFKQNLQEVEKDVLWVNIFIWELYVNLNTDFSMKKQSIRYGAPGTGKTFTAKLKAEEAFQFWQAQFSEGSNCTSEAKFEAHFERVQFHPSFSYEDFIEGLRPVPTEVSAGHSLMLVNGIFKDFCCRAAKWELDLHSLENKPAVKFSELTVADLIPFKEQLQGEHWSFILGADSKTLVNKLIPPFFFLIDEINRAELSRVFGELMFCLEYRGVEGRIKTQYSQLNTTKTAILSTNEGHYFFIPDNVYVMGTMNTIDRSVESFDFALRRRFSWIKVLPDYALLHSLAESEEMADPEKWKALVESLKRLNTKIAEDEFLGEDYCIGHAYLMNEAIFKSTNKLVMVWTNAILPLLEEYLRGNGEAKNRLEIFNNIFMSQK
jgi:5-methylcytosine-specific restriction protein B